MLISFGIVIVMMIWSRVPLSWNVFLVIPIMIDLMLLTFGVSTIFAHFGVFFSDLKNLTNVGLRVMFYMSGIFYVISDRVGGGHRHIASAGESHGISHRRLPGGPDLFQYAESVAGAAVVCGGTGSFGGGELQPFTKMKTIM